MSESFSFSKEDLKNLVRSAMIYLGPQIIVAIEQFQSGDPTLSIKAILASVAIDAIRRFLKDNTK